MNQLNNKIKIDRADGAADNASKGVEKMSNASKKMPWHLRFAPGAILRNGLIAVLAIATALTTVQTKAAIFTIDVITSWVIGEGLTAAKNKLLNDNGGMNKNTGRYPCPDRQSRREHCLLAFQLLRLHAQGG